MHIERGSTWNRWDFHVHTPYSIMNNQFGFDPDPEWKTDIAEFDEYVRTLFTKAVDKGIVAIGITDYFSIDGYNYSRMMNYDLKSNGFMFFQTLNCAWTPLLETMSIQ